MKIGSAISELQGRNSPFPVTLASCLCSFGHCFFSIICRQFACWRLRFVNHFLNYYLLTYLLTGIVAWHVCTVAHASRWICCSIGPSGNSRL